MNSTGSSFQTYINNLSRGVMSGSAGNQLAGTRGDGTRHALVLNPYSPSYGLAGAFELLRRRPAAPAAAEGS